MKRFGIVWIMAAGILHAQSWDGLVDQYFDEAVFRFSPSAATSAGIHQYDSSIEDFSQTAIQRQIAACRQYEKLFTDFPPAKLTPEQRDDREIVINNARATLLELESIRMWEKNPDNYSSAASNAAFVIMNRKFAPADVRLRALISREKQMPKMFADARANLKNPPKVYTDVAIEQLPGIVSFFEKDVPLAFQEVKDAALLGEFRKTNGGVVAALKAYETWLKTDLLPRSKGDFRIGADNYRKKLLYNEMVDIPLDRLLEIGYANLHANQQLYRDTAKKINPKKSADQILHEMEADHPPADKLLQSFRDTLTGLRDFITQKKLMTMPSQALPILEETPPFMRALTFASMDPAGPYETVAKESYFNVTLPEKSWTAKQVQEHMAAFSRGVIVSTAVHEAFPGHYVQLLWMPQAPSKIRKLIGANTYIEGWAHYCEQLMMDEGFGNADLTLRLGQLQDALLRNARYIVAIKMHTGQMTFDEAVDFFVKEGFQTRTNGLREVKRGTSDEIYLYYTLGKLEILKLREDYRKLKGSAFSMAEFHDTFLKQGTPPIKVVRRRMLGNESPVL